MSKNTQKQDQSTDLNSKKPMNGDAIHEGFEATGLVGLMQVTKGINFTFRAFVEGVRWAEEYHGIGGGE